VLQAKCPGGFQGLSMVRFKQEAGIGLEGKHSDANLKGGLKGTTKCLMISIRLKLVMAKKESTVMPT
jgi:hypothetical protein